jgi:choline dehydrogenase-like flavoprotein/nucleoside-diphosphate-sugar epimerase
MPMLDSSTFAGADTLPDLLQCDICIIGTGPAGATIARELSNTSLRVTLLESGGTERQKETDALNEIESIGWPREVDQWLVRNRVVGGTSETWGGRCAPFDDIDLEPRDWVPYSGWPFKMDELVPYFDRAAKHLGLGAGSAFSDDRVWAYIGHKPPKFDLDEDELLPMLWQISHDPINRTDRVRFGRHLAADLPANATLVTNATALRINVTESGAAVRSVEFADVSGRRWSLPASTVVVCAGGIENARLLLSSDDVVAQGLGNDNDLVGRFLMDHPRTSVARFETKPGRAAMDRFGVFKSRAADGNRYHLGARLSPAVQRAEQLPNCATWVFGFNSGPDDPPWDALKRFVTREANVRQDLRAIMMNTDLLLRGLKDYFILHRGLPHKTDAITLEAMCEQLPNPDSRIILSDRRDPLGMRISRIDWRVSAEEARAMRRITDLMLKQLFRMGLEPPVLEEWVRDGAMFPDTTIRDVAHPIGTTRMADDPARGVVDAQCQVHGIHGLFIAGSSVFPTAGHANPTQMIVALAVRLADTLRAHAAASPSSAHAAASPSSGKSSVQHSRQQVSEVGTMGTNAQTRVLVTGATGKIGSHVVNELLARGYQVRALTSKPVAAATANDRLQWCRLDFQESLEFDSLVRECAAVIHLAAESSATERMQRSNVAATRALAEASERAGVKVFCHTSSISVYGSSRHRRVREDSPVLTADHDVRSEYWAGEQMRCYGRTKLQGELAISVVARNVEYIILRPTVVIDVQDLVNLRDWGKARKLLSGSSHAHHIYVHDVADAILWFMERGLRRDKPLAGVSTFNLSEDDTPIRSFGQIFKAAYKASNDRQWQAAVMPWPTQWLLMMAKYRTLLVRQPLGRMLFSGDKLRDAGYTTPFGMPRVIASFCTELTSTGASAVKVVGSMRSAHDSPREIPPAP